MIVLLSRFSVPKVKIPPPSFAEMFPATVELVRVTAGKSVQIPPPMLVALLLEIVDRTRLRVPVVKMPPPRMPELHEETVQSIIVSVPLVK